MACAMHRIVRKVMNDIHDHLFLLSKSNALSSLVTESDTAESEGYNNVL